MLVAERNELSNSAEECRVTDIRTKKAYGNDLVYNSVWFFTPSLELRFTVLNNRLAFRMNALNHFRKPVFLLGL